MLGFDELRTSRDSWTVAYTGFLEEYKKQYKKTCYGFVEGIDDPSYYMTLITRLLPTEYKIRLFPSGNKKNVNSIYNKISWNDRNGFSKKRIVFFMDRDLSELVDDSYILKENNVYITEKYSIENDIANRDTCEATLRQIMGFAQTKQDLMDSVLDLFEKTKENFEKIMIPVMAHIISWKRKNIKATYNNIKVEEILRIELGEICLKKDRAAMIEYIYKQSKVNPNISDINEIQDIENEIAPIYSQIIRGKYLTTFFVLFCNSIFEDQDKLNIKAENSGCKISKIDMMRMIAPRCRLPESLKQFIENTLLKYIESLPKTL